ncbi:hypothetical protein ACIGG5_33660, partial [Streptomyces sp. NPDC085463]
ITTPTTRGPASSPPSLTSPFHPPAQDERGSLIHIPDDEISSVLAHFRRVLRPRGPLLLSFHVGDESRLKTEGYGGHPMKVYVHRRQHDQTIAWLNKAGFAVETHKTLTSAESKLGGIILARRQL